MRQRDLEARADAIGRATVDDIGGPWTSSPERMTNLAYQEMLVHADFAAGLLSYPEASHLLQTVQERRVFLGRQQGEGVKANG
jgi:hypothetical protein